MSGRKVRAFDKRAMRGSIRSGPNDAHYDPPFSYTCDGGHEIAASRPFTTCPAYVHGDPCVGILRRVGAGSGRGSNLARSA